MSQYYQNETIAASPILVGKRPGYKPFRVVIRRWNKATPFVVHSETLEPAPLLKHEDYHQGAYCETLEQAWALFIERFERHLKRDVFRLYHYGVTEKSPAPAAG